MTGGPPLIRPADLPDSLLEALSHEQIQQVGHFLFAQLAAQRDADEKFYTEVKT